MTKQPLSPTWSELKAILSRGVALSYTAFPKGTSPETYEYRIYGIEKNRVYTCHVSGSDATDFANNHISNAAAVSGPDSQLTSTAEEQTPIVCPSNQVWNAGTLTTSATTANQVVATYTVPSGKDLYILIYSAGRLTDTSVAPAPFRLRVNSTDFDAQGYPSGGNQSTPPVVWCNEIFPAQKIATAADVVTITVTPTGSTSTAWFAKFTGVLFPTGN